MRRLAAAAFAVLLCSLALAACGGSDSSSDSTATAAGDMQAFQDCLADHGVEMPTPPGGGALPDGATPPDGGTPPDFGSDSDSGSGSGADPATGEPPSAGGAPPQLSDEDQEAFDACSQYMPEMPQGGAPSAPPS